MSTIDDEASDWVVRQASGPLDAASQLAFEAWYDTGSRQQGAYLRAQAIWRGLDKATVQADLRPEASRRTAKGRAHRPSRRALLTAGVATSAAAGLVAVVLGPRLAGGVTLRTTLGEVRKVPLADRTIASLNSDSHLEVSMTPKLRRVVLVSGEALFEVAKNPERPFVVEAGEVSVKAVGTAFSVRRRTTGADVLVTEGVVEAWNTGGARRISAGEQAFVPYRAQPISVRAAPQEIERRLAWREGDIILNNQTLAEAALEFNRYNKLKIVIADPALGSHRLVGQYRADQPEQFVDAVQALLGVPVARVGDHLAIGGRGSASTPSDRS